MFLLLRCQNISQIIIHTTNYLYLRVNLCMKTVSQIKVSYLEGQLNSCKRTIERLEQELKKYVLFVLMCVF